MAIDGSKFRAQNSKKNNFNKKKIDRALEYHDKKMEQYLAALDRNDEDEEAWERLHRSTAQYLRHKELGEQLEAAAEKGETQVSTVDPDARVLPKHMNIVEVGYNVQAATDDRNCLVAHFEVTNKKDDHALSGMATKAKMELVMQEEDPLNGLADKGYDTGPELKKCAEANIVTYAAPKQNRPKKDNGRFRKQDFVYNDTDDTYICPWDELLTTNGTWYEKKARTGGQSPYRFKRYTITYPTCAACPYRDRCLNRGSIKNRHSLSRTRFGSRYIERSEFEGWSEANRERVEENKELYRKRQQIVEHPFGTIKRHWGPAENDAEGRGRVRPSLHRLQPQEGHVHPRHRCAHIKVQGHGKRPQRAIFMENVHTVARGSPYDGKNIFRKYKNRTCRGGLRGHRVRGGRLFLQTTVGIN